LNKNLIVQNKNGEGWYTGLGNKWTKVDAEYKGYINVMINAEIELEK